jgi:hypothetical protein
MPTVTSEVEESGSRSSVINAYENYDLKAEAPGARKPGVRFAFEFPELLAEFRRADAAAGEARDANRRWGKCGIVLVLIALLWASVRQIIPEWRMAGCLIAGAGYMAALAGLAGTCMGLAGGLRQTSQRDVWLRARLRTETLRLFHFYYIVARLPEIEAASSSPARRAVYKEARKYAFDVLLATGLQQPPEQLKEIVELRPRDPFAHVPVQHAVGPISETAADVMAAWGALRLDWQERYCQAKLAKVTTRGRLSPRQWEFGFSVIAWTCIVVVILLHILNLVPPVAERHWLLSWIDTVILCTATVALAARALEDGLKPQREVERYEQYLASVRVARVRFDAALDMQTRLEVMRAFEQTSMEEMRVFLRTYAKARYLL